MKDLKTPRVTIRDVSLAVGMSIATVNRALSGKPRVSEATRQRVVETARAMGYRANKAAQAMARKPVKLCAVLSESIPQFYNDVADGIRKAFAELSDFGVAGEIVLVPHREEPQDREAFIAAVADARARGAGGLILLPSRDVRGLPEVIDALLAQGVYTATVVTDIGGCRRVVSVGGNGVSAGRMAAEMLSLLCPGGAVAVFSSAEDVQIARENILGFTEGAALHGLTVASIYQNQDEPARARAAVDDLAARFPQIRGLYILSANSAAACARLEELGLSHRYAVVSTDLFTEIHQYMAQGVIRASLFQDPRRQGELVVHKLFEHMDGADPTEEVVLISPQLVLNSNRDLF